ncbi:MAG: methyltransferase domain-containing protein [Candidatus Omnitrophota bacterium]|nr:methyltransferase domain-containing protein [Candidatus Omnitrophota bacterium]
MVARHIERAGVHIDLACGDASLLKVSPCEKKIGLDRLYGDNIEDELDFPGGFADYVTMLAFIEHLEDPRPLLKECCRILKPEGRLILTTPLNSSKKYLRLWHKDLDAEHKRYFDKTSMERILYPYFVIGFYRRYFLNQLFICEKA